MKIELDMFQVYRTRNLFRRVDGREAVRVKGIGGVRKIKQKNKGRHYDIFKEVF